MSAFILKIIACITMFSDHIGYLLFTKISFFNYIGRLAFPIFAFQLAEGYSKTKNLKKYFLRLFSFAIISQIPFMLFSKYLLMSTEFKLNIFFTLFLGLLSIYLYDKNKLIGVISIIPICIISYILKTDYSFYGVLIILSFFIFKNNKILLSLSFILLTLLKYLYFYFIKVQSVTYIYLFIFTSLALIPILLYNKKQGKKVKYLLYFFYPVHLLIIYFLSILY